MIISASFQDRQPRLWVFGWIIGLGLGMLLVALARVQVVHTERYGDREQAQQLRRIRIPSARGEIVDRNGVVLANNRPSYDVVICLDQLGPVSKRQDIIQVANPTLGKLGQTMELAVGLTERDVRNHYQRRRPIPLAVWRNVRAPQVAAFAERASHLPGVDLVVTPVRQYPLGTLGAHLLGYVGRAPQPSDEEELEHYYYYEPDSAGRQGIERACDQWLRGAPGGRTIRVNPAGVKVGDVGEKLAERGHRVVLTIDARYQRAVEEALARAPVPAGKALRGAAVALDVRTGEVLALASAPTFDPNLFTPGTPAAMVNAVLTDPLSPMLNRVYGARYAPGSTFKPVTLLAGLEAGTVSPRDTVVCEGEMRIGRWPRPFRCWNARGHGAVDMEAAMKESCDVWFYQKGMAMGVMAIDKMATQFGIGQPTGLDLARDYAGLLPNPEWKRIQKGERWWDGDTAQLAIGQSFLLVTPLQMACVAAMFGNGQTGWRPFVVKRIETPDGQVVTEAKPQAQRQLGAKPQNIELVRQTMLAAVQSVDGTGHQAAVRGLKIAGKTGTAEFDTPTGRIKRVWFMGYAPYEQPQVAVAVLIEEGESGGHTAAPVAGEIFAKIFGKQRESVGRAGAYAD